MGTQGEIKRIQISEDTHNLLSNDFNTRYRGLVNIKGKGPQKTWWLLSAIK